MRLLISILERIKEGFTRIEISKCVIPLHIHFYSSHSAICLVVIFCYFHSSATCKAKALKF